MRLLRGLNTMAVKPDKRILLSYPHMSGDEIKYVQDAFDSNWIAPLGPHVDAFEKETAAYAGVKSALALSSGSAAIHLGLKLLGVQTGDTVFCSTLTFIAPAVYLEATPVCIDSAVEALGAEYRDRKYCSFGKGAVYSYNCKQKFKNIGLRHQLKSGIYDEYRKRLYSFEDYKLDNK